MEDGRIFNLSITFSQIFIFRIESPFSISFQNFAGHRRIRFFQNEQKWIDFDDTQLASGFVQALSRNQNTLSVSRSKSNRVERNVIFLRQPTKCENKSRVKRAIPDFRQPLAPSRRNCYPNRDHRSSGYNVKNWWKIRSMIGKYDPILLSQPVRISENCAEDEKSSSFSPCVAPYVPKKKKEKKDMETPPN